MDFQIVFLCRCSSINLWVSAVSAWVRGKCRPGKVCGTPGRSSMVWSQTVCCGRRCDSSSLKTLPWHWYSAGTLGFGIEDVVGLWKVTHPMKYCCDITYLGTFLVCGVKTAFLVFDAWRMVGSWVWSIQPLFQSILGCTAVNQEYPRIALWSPRSVRKKQRDVVWCPVLTFKSV